MEEHETEQERNNYPGIGQSFGITGILILGMIVLSPVYVILNKLIDREVSFFIYYILSIGIPFWIFHSKRKQETGSNTFNFAVENKRIVIPLIIISTIALLYGVISPVGNLIPMPDFIQEILAGLIEDKSFFSFLAVVVAAPILEELIFRGIILDGLLKSYSPIKSILISSLLFGIVHLNPWQFVTAFFVGVFAGWVYYKTKSLSLAIIIHATLNLTSFLSRFFIDTETPLDVTYWEAYGGVLNFILIVTGSLLVLGVCLYFLNKEFSKKPISGNDQ